MPATRVFEVRDALRGGRFAVPARAPVAAQKRAYCALSHAPYEIDATSSPPVLLTGQTWHYFRVPNGFLTPFMNPPVSRPSASSRGTGSRDPKSGRCPRCGRAFDCGQEARTADCWCRAMPPLPADRLKAGSRCLCPECLAEEIARAQNDPAAAAAADD